MIYTNQHRGSSATVSGATTKTRVETRVCWKVGNCERVGWVGNGKDTQLDVDAYITVKGEHDCGLVIGGYKKQARCLRQGVFIPLLLDALFLGQDD